MSVIRKNRNSVLHDSGSGFGVREYSFMVWPSVGLRISPDQYMAAVEFLKDASDIFFDGELIIIPKEDAALKQALENRFTIISVEKTDSSEEYKRGFGDEYATKAIRKGIEASLVILGSSLRGLAGSPDQMIDEALREPEAAKSRWKELYLSSMNEQ